MCARAFVCVCMYVCVCVCVNVGVVGPLCRQGNVNILTHDFVHRFVCVRVRLCVYACMCVCVFV